MSDASSDLFLEQLAVGPMQNFVYAIGSRRTREVALVDPAWDIDAILERVEAQDLRPVAALVTHYHPDHVGGSFMGQDIQGLARLLELRGLKAHVHREEVHGVKQLTGLSDGDIVQVDSGDTLTLGDVEVEFLHTPGHTPGSQCFRVRDVLVSGDTLFLQGCGRVTCRDPTPMRCTPACASSPPCRTTPSCSPATINRPSRTIH